MFWTFAGIWNRRTCWSAEASGWRKTSCTLLTLVCTFINSTTDFQRWAGLAKPYIDSETKKHIAYAERRSIIGILCQDFDDPIINYNDSNQSSIVMIAKYEKSLQISRDGEIHVCARASRDWTEPARWYGGHRSLKNSFASRILFHKKTAKSGGNKYSAKIDWENHQNIKLSLYYIDHQDTCWSISSREGDCLGWAWKLTTSERGLIHNQ